MQSLFALGHWKRSVIIRGVIRDLLAGIGVLWLLTEIVSFVSNSAEIWLSSRWWIFLPLALIYPLYSNRPKTKFSHKLKSRDVLIELCISDAFSLSGALVIPINTTFDTDLEGIISRSPSVQSKFLKSEYGSNHDHLDLDINEALTKEGYSSETINDKKIGKQERFAIGTVVKVRNEGRLFYLLAHTHINQNGRAIGTEEDLKISLAKLWYFISERGDKGDVVIPVLGTGHARIRLSREEVIRIIVNSFIASCSEENYLDKLTISILPEDVSKYDIDLSKLDEFLKFSCIYADFDIEPDVGIGTPFESVE